mmetsp:Transcript_783/g.3013  ORF Transcript_783/g.3013 Transcript_783/m.3013 type:complete len:214 (+) Transcript_783:2169-2810(+)
MRSRLDGLCVKAEFSSSPSPESDAIRGTGGGAMASLGVSTPGRAADRSAATTSPLGDDPIVTLRCAGYRCLSAGVRMDAFFHTRNTSGALGAALTPETPPPPTTAATAPITPACAGRSSHLYSCTFSRPMFGLPSAPRSSFKKPHASLMGCPPGNDAALSSKYWKLGGGCSTSKSTIAPTAMISPSASSTSRVSSHSAAKVAFLRALRSNGAV